MADIFGNSSNNTYFGGNGSDRYFLYGGNDYVSPGAGSDEIFGGSGTDWVSYYVATSPVIINQATETGLGYANGDSWDSIEKFSLSNTQNDIFYGGDGDTEVLGFGGDDLMKGAAGEESFNGGAGVDAVSYENSPEAVTLTDTAGSGGYAQGDTYSGIERFRGSDYNDTFWGTGADNEFEGRDGDDRFKGSAGADTFDGGSGNDVVDYSLSDEAVTILTGGIGAGGDAEGDTYESIEGGRGSRFDDTLGGDENANQLEGNDGNDFIKGNGGADTLMGDGGNDTLQGDDGADRLYGGLGNDTLMGDDGADYLDGGTGVDVMEGGLGNDFYIVDNAGDLVQGEIGFASGGGIDTVRAFIDYVQPTNVELVRLENLTDTSNLNATGNDAPGTLVGNAGNNVLTARGGNDQVNGNGGNDTLTGNTGRDTLVGGEGADTFVYNSVSESRTGIAERDVINGFDRGADVIDLRGVDAISGGADDAFTFIGTSAFSGAAGELRLQSLGGPNAVLVEGDVNGDGTADLQIFVNLQTTMLESDFLL